MSQVKESRQELPPGLFDWDRVAKVTCHANCSYQRACLLDAYIKDGKIVRLEQSGTHPLYNDPQLPDWNPRGCQKGLLNHHRMYDETRVKYPLKRAGKRGEGKWQRVTWDEALTEIADTMLDVITTEGTDRIIRFFGSGSGVVSENLSYEALLNALGIPVAAIMTDLGDEHQGAALVFGQPYVGCSVDNYYYADLLLIWGGNPSYTNIPNYHWITEGRYNGTKVVTISPDYSASAVQADLWVPVNIGTDAALALSMAEVIVREKLYKEDFLKEQTDFPLLVREDNHKFLREADVKRGGRDDIYYMWDTKSKKMVEAPDKSLTLGNIVPALEGEHEAATLRGKIKVNTVFELLKKRLEGYTPEKAHKVTGVAPELIEQLAREVAEAKKVINMTTFNWGKFYHGDEIERSIVLVFALCGHFGSRGNSYNAFTAMSPDAHISGVYTPGWLLLRTLAANDPRYATWKSQGYTDEMMVQELNRDIMDSGAMVGSGLFHFVHSGLLEWSKAHNSWDPTLKRPVAEYVKEALDKKWHVVVPKQGDDPRILFCMGGSFLRRCRGTEQIINTLLPKLRAMVVIDHRMTGTNMYADYVLPAAGWFEKFSLNLTKTDYPYAMLINKVEEPQYESKGEWEIGCLLAKKLEERAKARGIARFKDPNGRDIRLDNLYEKATLGGVYTEKDEEAVVRDYYASAANLQQIPWEEFKEKAIVPAIGLGQSTRGIGNTCDVEPGEPLVPLTFHLHRKEPYPTQTRRMQFYIDHDWYLEFGEELPVQKEDPKSGGDYPLRLTGGHARWSIHSSYSDDAILLRLQRGEPVIYVNPQDAKARGISDGDMVEAYNDVASYQTRALVASGVKPGQVIVYHAWENTQFKGFKHNKSVMATALNPLELVGGYYHLRSTPDCFNPGFSDRETRVDLRKAKD